MGPWRDAEVGGGPPRTREYPKLRAVEAFPTVIEGREVICLRDPAGFTDAVLVIPRPLIPVLALFDGEHSLLDIQAEVMRQSGELLYRDRLEELVETLDRQLFLEGPRLESERARLEAAFRAGPTRPPLHAGKAYAGDPPGLRAQLEACFTHADGPGLPGPATAARLRAVIAPHIDLHRGGPAYAWAYRAVAEAAEADCFIIFGTAHAGMPHPFAVTLKAYDTPLGPLPVDREFVEALGDRYGGDLLGSELAHRAEHSIEFQAVFLRHLFGEREIRAVPVLTSFLHECLQAGKDPETDPGIAGFFEAVAETMATLPRRYCLIAGADLAHVGPRFGDPEPISPARLREVAAEDRAMLAHVERADARGFFEAVARDGDRRRICGLSPIYALLRAADARTGRLLAYRQWPDPQGTVTFASMVFE